jgi:hypothetical protein
MNKILGKYYVKIHTYRVLLYIAGRIAQYKACHCFKLEDGTDGLSRNVGKKVPFYNAQSPKTAHISYYYSNLNILVTTAFGKLTPYICPRICKLCARGATDLISIFIT